MVKNGDRDEGARVYVDLKRHSYTVVPSKKAVDATQRQPREKQFTTVYLNVKTGTYSVHPYVKGPVSWTQFGEPTVLTSEQFGSQITAAVLENLEKFNKAVFNQALARKRTPTEQRTFIKQNLSVFVARLETNDIKVSPQHREHGGYTGDYENTVLLKPEEIAQKLPEAIRGAFEKAS